MNKAEAIALLGGTATAAARAIGISSAAVSLWPEVLPPRIADRVQAALYRQANPKPAAMKARKPAKAEA
jgi:transcriptional repressor of cell division inhibition gene dicB